MPRPMRARFLRAPSRSASSCNFIVCSLCLLCLDDANQVLHLGEHSTNLRRVRDLRDPANAIEAQTDQRGSLGMMAADRAAHLLDLYDCLGFAHAMLPCVAS